MQWIEAIINISALAGFIGVANLKRHQTREASGTILRSPHQRLPK
jgi:hypothetical protein